MSFLICDVIVQMEKLLVLSSEVAYASSSEGADVPLSANGAYAGKPFSEYIG